MTRCTVPQTTTAAIRIHRIRYPNCAAPGYLARAGTPRSAEDLAMHAYVVSRSASNGRLLPWRLKNLAGEDALAGAGLVYIHSYMVQASLDAGRGPPCCCTCRTRQRQARLTNFRFFARHSDGHRAAGGRRRTKNSGNPLTAAPRRVIWITLSSNLSGGRPRSLARVRVTWDGAV
jgi:hypothetical protein